MTVKSFACAALFLRAADIMIGKRTFKCAVMQHNTPEPYQQLLQYLNSLSEEARARVSAEMLFAFAPKSFQGAEAAQPESERSIIDYLLNASAYLDEDPEFERIELEVREVDFE